ncbi:unnamed protein product [Protopolystoma xenopodis]|uniref:Uncharacterized protein n=1 Tax=Protopolystoma xenopodis TaxID=117903 RepID=A0A448XD97_9PLAT|nr:unnamed protein product [Protopolystoma xenopodis]
MRTLLSDLSPASNDPNLVFTSPLSAFDRRQTRGDTRSPSLLLCAEKTRQGNIQPEFSSPGTSSCRQGELAPKSDRYSVALTPIPPHCPVLLCPVGRATALAGATDGESLCLGRHTWWPRPGGCGRPGL